MRRSLNIKVLKEKRKWIHRSSWTILDHKKTYCTIIIKSSSYSRLLSELNCQVMSSIVWLQPPVVYYGLLLKGFSAAFEARASYASWRSRHLLSEENWKMGKLSDQPRRGPRWLSDLAARSRLDRNLRSFIRTEPHKGPPATTE